MRTFIIWISLIITVQLALGQDTLVLTKEQNDIWVSRIEKSKLDVQLKLIRERILSDTNIYVRTSAPDRLKIGDESNNGKRQEAFCRPLIVFIGKCNYLTPIIGNKTKDDSICQLVSLLTTNNIDGVTIFKGDTAIALFGSRALGGAFLLSLKKKSTCKKIDSIEFGQW